MQARRLKVIGQLRASQCLGQRLAQCGQQAPPLAAQGLTFFGTHAEQCQRPIVHRQRPPPPAPERQGAGARAGRLIMLPGPIGGGALGFGELQRPTGFDFPAALTIAIEQAQFQVGPAVEVLRRSADHSLTVGGGGEFARQVEQFAGFFLGVAQGLQLSPLPRRQVAGEGRHQQKEQQSQHVFFALDAEGESRRNEQKVIGQKRQCRAGQCRAETAAHRHQQYRREEHQRNVRQRQDARHRPGQGTGKHRRHQRQRVVEPDQRLRRALARLMLFVIAVEHVDFQPASIAQ